MIDVLEQHSLNMDIAGLEKALRVPVIAVSAKSGSGLEELQDRAISHTDCPALTAAILSPAMNLLPIVRRSSLHGLMAQKVIC